LKKYPEAQHATAIMRNITKSDNRFFVGISPKTRRLPFSKNQMINQDKAS